MSPVVKISEFCWMRQRSTELVVWFPKLQETREFAARKFLQLAPRWCLPRGWRSAAGIWDRDTSDKPAPSSLHENSRGFFCSTALTLKFTELEELSSLPAALFLCTVAPLVSLLVDGTAGEAIKRTLPRAGMWTKRIGDACIRQNSSSSFQNFKN